MIGPDMIRVRWAIKIELVKEKSQPAPCHTVQVHKKQGHFPTIRKTVLPNDQRPPSSSQHSLKRDCLFLPFRFQSSKSAVDLSIETAPVFDLF
jgi:hypothetical protein